MFQWDAVDTSLDWGGGGQNVLKTFEIAIQHNRRTTRTELQRVFCRWTYFYLPSKYFPGLLRGVTAPIASSMDPPLTHDALIL